jgi:predicted ArsR family transcriptional regulator
MLKQPEGVTIGEAAAALGWQPHTVRGAFAGALKKKRSIAIASDKVDGRGRVYRIVDPRS